MLLLGVKPKDEDQIENWGNDAVFRADTWRVDLERRSLSLQCTPAAVDMGADGEMRK